MISKDELKQFFTDTESYRIERTISTGVLSGNLCVLIGAFPVFTHLTPYPKVFARFIRSICAVM